MGWERVEIRIVTHLSRHNSEQDGIDNAQFKELLDRIDKVCDEDEFTSINPVVVCS